MFLCIALALCGYGTVVLGLLGLLGNPPRVPPAWLDHAAARPCTTNWASGISVTSAVSLEPLKFEDMVALQAASSNHRAG
jgi:hypothetical protein